MALLQYISGRVASYILVLFIGVTITFFLPRFMPGDPIQNYIFELETQAGQTLSPDEMANLRAQLAEMYGLEGSLFSQYLGYLARVFLHLDFGPSYAAFPAPAMGFIMITPVSCC